MKFLIGMRDGQDLLSDYVHLLGDSCRIVRCTLYICTLLSPVLNDSNSGAFTTVHWRLFNNQVDLTLSLAY